MAPRSYLLMTLHMLFDEVGTVTNKDIQARAWEFWQRKVAAANP